MIQFKYFYYLHGPLARVETGHDKVQGTDYAYTLHGWIKGVNSNLLKATHDIGKDGNGTLTVSSADVNKFSGRDVYSYALTYFNNSTQKDYKAINGISGTSTDFMAAAPSVQTADLYNGNIRQMAGSYLDGSAPGRSYGVKALLRDFTYDQLNRIETASANDNLNAGANSWGAASSSSLYTESFNYDQNGNILHAQRNGDQSGSYAMDNLTYHYVSGTNKLAYVTDAVSGDPYSQDIGNQGAGNYDYDAIGNLIKDNAEGISNIDWTVYGKIKRITFSNGKPNLLFKYDASGNRISKTAFMGSTPATTATTTYYVRDAQGNVMATYEQKPDGGNNPTFGLTERHIYGSSRLGLDNSPVDFTSNINVPLDITSTQRTLNYRSYEMTNHLGNVMAVVSDRKIGVYQSTVQLLSRIFDDGDLSSVFPDVATTSIVSNALQVIPLGPSSGVNVNFGSTVAGKVYKVEFDINYGTTTPGNNLQVYIYDLNVNTVSGLSAYNIYGSGHYVFYYTAGPNQGYVKFAYQGSNSASNYFLVDNISILDENASTIDHFTGEVLSANDYYAFGATMPGRSFTSSSYRYGFNGKENDKESVGTGNGTQDYGFRIYNPSLGKFLSVDPLTKKYPMLTPYQFASNRPVDGIDQDGLEYLDAKNDKITSQSENKDHTYQVTLGKHTFSNVTKETIGGRDYFNLRMDMYYNDKKNKWSTVGIGKDKVRMTHGLMPPLDQRTFSVKDFISKEWPQMTGSAMTESQKETLKSGCVGISSCIIGESAVQYTKNSGGYKSLGLAQAAKAEMALKNPNEKYIIYSVRFYSASEENFLPDKKGFVNMKDWNHNETKGEGFYNFDFGYLNESTGMWWHANHADEPAGSMEIYQGTLFDYSRSTGSFNRQVYVVAPANNN